jgi:transcriptional regulator with XRE-family HTH domain
MVKDSHEGGRRRAFGAALAKRRHELSLSQAALGKALGGVGQSAISQWECGETQPRPDHVYAAERVLGLSPGSLSRLLGYLPPSRSGASTARDVHDAIKRDPLLTDREKRSFIVLYEAIAAGREGRVA